MGCIRLSILDEQYKSCEQKMFAVKSSLTFTKSKIKVRRDYLYGFNGKENDNEVKGDGNQQDYGMRIYDPRLGRFLSVDPLASKFPHMSPYAAFNNNPLRFTDPTGAAPLDKILLNQKGEEISRIKEDAPDQYYMQHDKGNYTWTTTTSVNGNVTNVQESSAIRVLSKESVTGDPRENERSGISDGAAFYRNGNLNENWTGLKQASEITTAIDGVASRYEIAMHSKGGGSMDFKPKFNVGELTNLDGIYMNNHEALNFMWGKCMSELNCRGNTPNGISVEHALTAAEAYNKYDHIFGDSKTWGNQSNHNEAIVRGYFNSSTSISLTTKRDIQVFVTLVLHATGEANPF